MDRIDSAFADLLSDCGVQAAYLDVHEQQRSASPNALLGMLNALGIEINSPNDAGPILRERQRERLQRGLQPVHVAWDGTLPFVDVSLPAAARPANISYALQSDSACLEDSMPFDKLQLVSQSNVDSDFAMVRLPLGHKLGMGYYDLQVQAGDQQFRSRIISAPRRAFRHEGQISSDRSWGCFLPLYSLRTKADWGVGDFSSLREFACWAGGLGATDVGVLPMLAAFLDEPFRFSPYGPTSRLFWNELFLDVEAVPELAASAAARTLVESANFRKRLEEQRGAELVDYRETMALKRKVLSLLATEFFSTRPARFAAFEQFMKACPAVNDYAAFRAAGERAKKEWMDWPADMKSGQLSPAHFDERTKNYHAYVQWLAVEQLTHLRQKAEAAGSGLYLDLPIGVDWAGYDVWRHPSSYIMGASAGAPPDVFFAKGQNWGLPPLHPERIREDGYDLFRRVLETNMRFARHLRIDHVMGFHRMYCIPPGLPAADGAYIHYAAEELFAIASLESHRQQCELVGENLGTVPKAVDRALEEHSIAGMWVAQYELEPGRHGLVQPTVSQVAMLNTHDMPPVAAWWRGDDIADRHAAGQINVTEAAQQKAERQDAKRKTYEWLCALGLLPDDYETANVPLLPLLQAMSRGAARLVVLNLEDLWLETRPQNLPGTCWPQVANWQRKAKFTFEEFSRSPDVLRLMQGVNEMRKVGGRQQAAGECS